MRYAIWLMIVIIFCAGILFAQDDDYNEEGGGPVTLAPGLTQKQIGNFSVVTAEDAAVTTNGKQAYVEDLYRYVGRKFKAVEARLKKLEDHQAEILDRLKQVEGDLAKIKKYTPLP